jgi:CheY-like chemotaxis protein
MQATVVLVAEQDLEPRQRLAGWLRQAGYQVLTIARPPGRRALLRAAAHQRIDGAAAHAALPA